VIAEMNTTEGEASLKSSGIGMADFGSPNATGAQDMEILAKETKRMKSLFTFGSPTLYTFVPQLMRLH
jgi:hypothetical protein